MDNSRQLAPWRTYMVLIAESVIAFYLASFCIAMYFSHRGTDWLIPAIFMIVFYLFVIFVCARRVSQKLPLATLMLMIPITPLVALIIIVSMIPIIQFFKN